MRSSDESSTDDVESSNWAKIATPSQGKDMRTHLAQLDKVPSFTRGSTFARKRPAQPKDELGWAEDAPDISSDSENAGRCQSAPMPIKRSASFEHGHRRIPDAGASSVKSRSASSARNLKSVTRMSPKPTFLVGDEENDREGPILIKPHAKRRGSASRFGSTESEGSPKPDRERFIRTRTRNDLEIDGPSGNKLSDELQRSKKEMEDASLPSEVAETKSYEAEGSIAPSETHKRPDGPLLIHLNAADVEDMGNGPDLAHNVNLTASTTDHTALQRFSVVQPSTALRKRNPWKVPVQSVLHQPKVCILDCLQRCKNSTDFVQLDNALSQLLHLSRLHRPTPHSGPYLSSGDTVISVKMLVEVLEQFMDPRHPIHRSLYISFPPHEWSTLRCVGYIFQSQLVLFLKLVTVIRVCFEEVLQSGWESPQRSRIRDPAVFLQTHLQPLCDLYVHNSVEIASTIDRAPSLDAVISSTSATFRALFPPKDPRLQETSRRNSDPNSFNARASRSSHPEIFPWYWRFLCVHLQHECEYLSELVRNPTKFVEEAHIFIKTVTHALRAKKTPSPSTFAWTTNVYVIRILTQWVRAEPVRFPLLSAAIQTLRIFEGKLSWQVPVAVISALAELSFEGGPMGRRACLGRTTLETDTPPTPQKNQLHDSLLAFREFYGVYGIFDPGSHNHQVRCVVAEYLFRLQHSPDLTIRESARKGILAMEQQERLRSRKPKRSILQMLKFKTNPELVRVLLNIIGLTFSDDGQAFEAPKFALLKKSGPPTSSLPLKDGNNKPIKSILSLSHHECEVVSNANSWWRSEPEERKSKSVNWAADVVSHKGSEEEEDNAEEAEEEEEELAEDVEPLPHDSSPESSA